MGYVYSKPQTERQSPNVDRYERFLVKQSPRNNSKQTKITSLIPPQPKHISETSAAFEAMACEKVECFFTHHSRRSIVIPVFDRQLVGPLGKLQVRGWIIVVKDTPSTTFKR
jgi:hypothetical protein